MSTRSPCSLQRRSVVKANRRRADRRGSIFKRGKKIDLPAPALEALADRLADKGLLTIERRTYVRCVNPLDDDQQYVKDTSCAGRILLRADLDEDNQDYRCPDCGRVIFPGRKQKHQMVKLRPVPNAIRGFIRGLLEQLDVEVREAPSGLFRLSGRSGEVQVAVADFCQQRAVFQRGYPAVESLVFVVGNERDFSRHLQNDAPSFLLIDLADGDAVRPFHRELRRLLRLHDATADTPAILGLGASSIPVVEGRTATPDPYPGATRIPAPSGTTWSQVSIYNVDGETLAIRIPGHEMARYTHVQLGMANKRNGKPTKIWAVLDDLCEHNGQLPWNDSPNRFNAFKERVSKLRPLLQHIFDIKADPFPECSRTGGLRAAFRAFPDPPDVEPPYVGEREW